MKEQQPYNGDNSNEILEIAKILNQLFLRELNEKMQEYEREKVVEMLVEERLKQSIKWTFVFGILGILIVLALL